MKTKQWLYLSIAPCLIAISSDARAWNLSEYLPSFFPEHMLRVMDVEVQPAASNVQAVLGTGYDTNKQLFKGGCLQGNPVYQGLDQATVNFKQTISHDQLEQELGVGAAGRARIGIIEASASAKFLSQSKSDEFSISAIYSGDYQFKNVILTAPHVSDTLKAIVNNDERWLEACGNEFVEQMKLGAKIFFSIRIDFASQADKKAFQANFNISGPLFSASGEIRNAMNQFSQRTQVTVSAFQIGGKVSELSRIFGDSGQFVKCSLGEFDKCEKVLASALTYATQTFPTQLDGTTPDPTQPGGPAVLLYMTKPFATAGIFPKNPPLVAAEVKKARLSLDNYLTSYYEQWTRVEKFLSSSIRRLSDRQTTVLNQMRASLKNNRERIINASQTCYDNPTQDCVLEVSAMTPGLPGGLFQIAPKDLIIQNESFAQYCDEGLSPQAAENLISSISGLMGFAHSKKPELFKAVIAGQAIDECFVAGNFLAKQRVLDLSHLSIADLSPLSGFAQLEELNLNDNRVVDLSPLAIAASDGASGALTHIKRLFLARNQIQDVTPLGTLSQLEILSLNGNQISNASALSNLGYLYRLDLRNNSLGLACPITNKEACLTSDYANSGQFVGSERRDGLPRYGLTATSVNGPRGREVLLVGGILPSDQDFAEVYRGGDGSYHMVKGPSEPRIYHSATLLEDGSVLILGGQGFASGMIYHPDTHTFIPLRNRMASMRGSHTATRLKDGRVLITGGWSTPFLKGASQSVEIYDPKQQTFKLLNVGLSVPRANHTATLLPDGRVLIAGGYDDQKSIITADVFDPANETVSPLVNARMNRGRGAHQATLLKDGRVLITGGFDGAQALDSAEIFDPAQNSFKMLAMRMHDARGAHQSNLLANGLILLTGGLQGLEDDVTGNSCRTCVASAELFDPVTEDFTLLNSNMNHPRAYHAAVNLSEGIIYIFGGMGSSAGLTAEIFTYGMR